MAALYQLLYSLCITRDTLASKEEEFSALVTITIVHAMAVDVVLPKPTMNGESSEDKAQTSVKRSAFIDVNMTKTRTIYLSDSSVVVAVVRIDIP